MDLTVAHSASSLKPGAAPIILLKSEIGVPQLAKKLNQDWSGQSISSIVSEFCGLRRSFVELSCCIPPENRKSLLPLPPVVKHFSHRDALFIDILIARLFSSLLSSPFLVSVLAQSGYK